MADRGITGSYLTATQKDAVTYYDCVKFELTVGGVTESINLTNAPYDITVDATQYDAVGQLMAISEVGESSELEIADISVTVGAHPDLFDDTDGLLADVVAEDTLFIDKPLEITRVYFDPDNLGSQIGNTVIFEGFIKTLTTTYDSDVISVGVTAGHKFVDFSRVTGRKTNKNSQQFYYPSDKGMNYTTELQKELEWKPE